MHFLTILWLGLIFHSHKHYFLDYCLSVLTLQGWTLDFLLYKFNMVDQSITIQAITTVRDMLDTSITIIQYHIVGGYAKIVMVYKLYPLLLPHVFQDVRTWL